MRELDPKGAQLVISQGNVDVIDVREINEYGSGHVPTARNVPLGELKTDPKKVLTGGRVLFVCAKGVRSATAAQLADELGIPEVFTLAGGTNAWDAAGLPLEHPTKPERVTPREPRDPSAEETLDFSPKEPELDVVVGENMKHLREARGLSLDQVARMTGLSRTVLGQIELGKTPPSVSVVWKIAQAFEVHFSALLATQARLETRVLRAGDAKRLVSPDGRYSSRALYPFAEKPEAEFYELFLAAKSREDAQPHAPGTRENLIVTSGKLELQVGEKKYELEKGDAIVFTADVPHAYVNISNDECWMYLVMTYKPLS
jgi:rhodanese-related sulfurtransferase/transcriptional regulator with XRE-family HTH domain